MTTPVGNAPFPITPPSPSWATFRDALARTIEKLEDRESLVIERPPSTGYVQVLRRGQDLFVETTSNVFRSSDELLDDDALAMLRTLGWRPPEPEHGRPNFHQRLPWDPSGSATAALLITATQRAVLGIALPDEFQVIDNGKHGSVRVVMRLNQAPAFDA
jgi:hypothetical protein